jgi:hypothetical protein
MRRSRSAPGGCGPQAEKRMRAYSIMHLNRLESTLFQEGWLV